MTEEQSNKCHIIIHTCAAGSGGGNAVPIPGLGLAADSVALTTMVLSLSAIFGGGLAESAAKTIAIAALKRQIQKQPIKYAAKEISKFIPFAGSIAAATISVALIEAAGWEIANDLDRKYNT